MLINSLSVLNFRNFESADIKFSPRLNIIIGNNGQGKTNIIEALYLLIEGESFRYSKNENLIRLGQSQALVRAQAVSNELDFNLNLRLSSSKKDFSINGKSTSNSRMTNLAAILFSPESLNIIKESSDERRQLADQLVEQIALNGTVIIREFKKVLKSRNRILKDISEEKIDFKLGKDTLESINPSFLKLAAELTYLRISTLNEIKPEVEKALNSIHGSHSVKFGFKYLISDVDHHLTNLENLLFFLQKRMTELAIPELKSGVSLVGPHKHDITFLYNGNDSRFYCSQGQQRSIILAYKMAQIVYYRKVHGFYPLLLLDDVLSELDLAKQESLISTLNQTETQTFVTSTDVSLLSKLSINKASVFNIHDGKITV